MTEVINREQYKASGGNYCPICQATYKDLVYTAFDYKDCMITQFVDCTSCGATWTDLYSFQGYMNLKDHMMQPMKAIEPDKTLEPRS